MACRVSAAPRVSSGVPECYPLRSDTYGYPSRRGWPCSRSCLLRTCRFFLSPHRMMRSPSCSWGLSAIGLSVQRATHWSEKMASSIAPPQVSLSRIFFMYSSRGMPSMTSEYFSGSALIASTTTAISYFDICEAHLFSAPEPCPFLPQTRLPRWRTSTNCRPARS